MIALLLMCAFRMLFSARFFSCFVPRAFFSVAAAHLLAHWLVSDVGMEEEKFRSRKPLGTHEMRAVFF